MEKTKNKRSRSSKMNVLFVKDKLIMENNNMKEADSLTSLAFASGDCFVPERRCNLCNSASHLKNINLDHCDEVLSRLFNVEVPDHGEICESCVKCLKVCERFKILVNSSFEKKPNARPSSCDQSTETDRGSVLPTINPQKEIIDLLTASLTSKPKKKPGAKTVYVPPTAPPKRTNIACIICLQKYLIITPENGINNFICCRCKLNELKLVDGKKKLLSLPANDLRSKNNLMGKNRLSTVQKSPHVPTLTKTIKHQCHLCPKSYVDPQHLAKHIETMHETCYVCHVCGMKIRNKDIYERHIKIHSSSKSESYTIKRSSLKIHSSVNKFETVIRA